MTPEQRVAAVEIVPGARSWGCDEKLALCIAAGESDLNVYAEGDGGASHGIFQVYLGLPGRGTREDWIGLDGLRRSCDFVRPRWQRELTRIPDATDRWTADPVAFLAFVWPKLQG